MREKLQKAYEAEVALKKQELENTRFRDQILMSADKDGYSNILKPKYKYDERLKIQVEVN